MKTYQEAAQKLGNHKSRKLKNNTYLQRRNDNTIAVKLHETDVVTYYSNGKVKLDSGGWRTVTTKDRINQYSPIGLFQDKGIWYIGTWGEKKAIYNDGMIINEDGSLTGTLKPSGLKKEQKLRESIKKYAKDYVTALKSGKIGKPDNGDCWYCYFKETNSKKSLGDISHNNDHFLSHIKEKYYVPSLVWNALESTGASQITRMNVAIYQGMLNEKIWIGLDDQIERSIRKYIYRQLGLC
jgi:hypothetical protein